jgi:hypothetical protein
MLEYEDLDAHLVQAARREIEPECTYPKGTNVKLEELAKNIDVEKTQKDSAVYTMWGVDKCRAPQGCESIQYGCRAWRCQYNGTKDRWPNDASSHYSRKR